MRKSLIAAGAVGLIGGAAFLVPSESEATFGRCGLLKHGNFTGRMVNAVSVGVCPKSPDGKPEYSFMPAPRTPRPSYDPATEVLTGPTYTVGAQQITEVWTVRAKTAQELDDAKTATVESINRAVLKVLCRLENHDRVSDGKGALTDAQCFNAFKGLL